MSQNSDYQRIAQAIAYLQANYRQQPTLDELAEHIHLSPYHLQRLFSRWAGISPKKFIQFLSVEHAKSMLSQQASLLETSHALGLSGPSRLHDLFIQLEAMTPGEYKKGGAELTIRYEFLHTSFGQALIASTDRGICHLHFVDAQEQAMTDLKARFPQATYFESSSPQHVEALAVIDTTQTVMQPLTLHLQGTPFQIKVWQSLLRIPRGAVCSYGQIAEAINQPSASRAVGTAIAANPLAYLIPCHRVIQASGHLGGYRWGGVRKSALIAWEACREQS